MLIIKDAQLILNTYRMFQGTMDSYQDSMQEQVHVLSKPYEGEGLMMHSAREVLKDYCLENLRLHKKAVFRLDQGFKGSKESRKQLKTMGHSIGLRIALKDCLGVLNNQSELYKHLGHNFRQMGGLLFAMLVYGSPQEHPEVAQSIHQLTDHVKVAEALAEVMCDFLKLMGDSCLHAQQEQGSGVVQATDLFNRVVAEQARLQAQEETGSTPTEI